MGEEHVPQVPHETRKRCAGEKPELCNLSTAAMDGRYHHSYRVSNQEQQAELFETEQIRLKVSATLASAKIPPSNIIIEERKAILALCKDPWINILPVDKGRCTVILNTSDYHTKITSLLSDHEIYEVLKRDPAISYKKKVIDPLQGLEKDHIIDCPSYYRLYSGEANSCIYGPPKIHKEEVPSDPLSAASIW